MSANIVTVERIGYGLSTVSSPSGRHMKAPDGASSWTDEELTIVGLTPPPIPTIPHVRDGSIAVSITPKPTPTATATTTRSTS